MSNLSVQTLAENIQLKNVRDERKRLVEKWEKTRLLSNLEDRQNHQAKSNMAQLLENQALHEFKLLNEATAEANIKGFQSIAFPMVRRIFGGLIANELVSVQPMAMPSGLLFYLDFTYGTPKAGTGRFDWAAGGSIFGDQVDPGTPPGNSSTGTGGNYYLNTSYSARELTGAASVQGSGSVTWDMVAYDFELSGAVASNTLFYADVNLTGSGQYTLSQIDATNYKQFAISGSGTAWNNVNNIFRRHNTYNAQTGTVRIFYSASSQIPSSTGITASFVAVTGLTVTATGAQVAPQFETDFRNDIIPEINLQIQSVAVTANSRKLKARWTPEAAQDLQAYQNIDAEVELTQILAEQISVEIDREILQQLLTDGTGAVMYWSRKPGNFVNKLTGLDVGGGQFMGNTVEWYHTLIETINDVANTIHRKTLRGKANFIVCSPDVATILESMAWWKPAVIDGDVRMNHFALGIERIGTLNNTYTVYKDPYFPRNIMLIGFKGNSFLESGYVYAPYIPLVVTPTIYGPEDFAPRKGIMTRYAKAMVRTDFYGKIIIKAMDVI